MANIRIERLPIQSFYLGYFGFDHLQLAFEQSSQTPVPVPQDEWFIIEGTRAETPDGVKLGVIGSTGNLPQRITAGGYTGDELIQHIGTPETRGSQIIVSENAEAAWSIMANWSKDIADDFFNYYAYGNPISLQPTLNSSSLIASLLYAAGLDVASNMPRGLRLSPGTETLLGSFADDHLQIHAQFTAIFGNAGEDLLEGTNQQDRIDRMYGGGDNDLLGWSQGSNYLHGGDSSWSYQDDGFDTVDYTGAGDVNIEFVENYVEHISPQYIAEFETGRDLLMSIERLVWGGDTSDTITTGPGVELMITPLSMYGGGQASSGQGDVIDFGAQTAHLLINRASDEAHFVTAGNQGSGGLWLESIEWIVGGGGSDRIYGGEGLRGIEGGAGDDFIDTRLVTPFAGNSPQGYDVEILGGAGADTIIGNAGRTYVDAGAEADRFVLSSITGTGGTVEFVIANSDALDTLYVPYNYFDMSGGGYDDSPLMRITGAIGTFDEMANYGWELYHEYRLQEQIWTEADETHGMIDFAGTIAFRMENADLIISVFQGERVTETVVIDDAGNTEERSYNIILQGTETIIRVVDFQEGDLGLQFLDAGNPYVATYQGEQYSGYTNWNAAVLALNPAMLPAFDARPSAPISDPNDPSQSQTPTNRQDGTGSDDVIALTSPSHVDAGAGNDTITSVGDNDDVIDGGSGADSMAGGGGDDRYAVDDAGDTVLELANAGEDTVNSSIDYTLTADIENLNLIGTAFSGTGNAGDNRINGNDSDNVLSGGEGNDLLYGEAGNDLLTGGEGSDVYIYARSSGWDTIDDTFSSAGEIDELNFIEGISANDLSALRLSATSDDIVLLVEGGGRITIAGALAGHGVEEISFADGMQWTAAEISAFFMSAAVATSLPPEAFNDSGLIYGNTDGLLLSAPLLANDIDPTGGPLTLVAVSDLNIGSASVTSDGNVALALPPGYVGPLSFRYTVANAAGDTSSAIAEIIVVPNAAPVLTAQPSNVTTQTGTVWSWTIPASLFTDADGDALTYSVTLADGTPLPPWLGFSLATLTLSGTPPTDATGDYDIRITAYDGFVITGADFTLTVEAGTTPDPDQVLSATNYDDVLIGGSGNDTFTVSGNLNGFDFFQGGLGYDVVQGTPWNDTISLANAAGNLDGIEAIDGGEGTDVISLTLNDDIIDLTAIAVTGIERIEGGLGSDTITGSASGDVIRGGGGNDLINGGAGNDTFTILGNAEGYDVFVGGDGHDTIRGSAWNDTIALANVAGNLGSVEVIDGSAGTDILRLSDEGDNLDLANIAVIGIELIDAGLGNDTVTGSAGDDTIRGNGGDDLIDGDAGNDTFTVLGTTDGFDVFMGGLGFDAILGSAWNDTIGLALSAQNLSGIERIDAGGGNDTIRLTALNDAIDLSALDVVGVELIDAGTGSDVVTGSAGNDVIRGNAGDDILDGRAGNDTFTVVGNAEGHDTFLGGDGFDTILGSAWNDTIGLAGTAGNLSGIDRVDGGAGYDIIAGTAGADTIDLSSIEVLNVEMIDAGGGDDTLMGSLGSDVLRGGTGQDTFVFATLSGHDTIVDFTTLAASTTAHDTIDLSGFALQDFSELLALGTQVGSDAVFTFATDQSLTLQGVNLASLTAADVVLA